MRRIAAYLSVYLILVNSMLAATRTASVSGNWHDAATWGGSAAPTSADDAQINNGITVTCEAGQSCTSKTLICSTTGGNCTFNMGIGATYTYHGNVAMGSSDWTFDHGFKVYHDDDGVTANHFTWTQNYAGKLVLNGTVGDRGTWGIAGGSGYAGTIGNGAGSGANGQLHATHVDFSDVSSTAGGYFWQVSLNGSGAEYSCDDCTWTRVGSFFLSAWHGAANVSITNSTYTSGYNGPHGVWWFYQMGAKTGGTRAFTGNYWDTGPMVLYATSDNLDVGMTFQDNVCNLNSSTLYCVDQPAITGGVAAFSGTNWQNNLVRMNNPANASTQPVLVYPSGTTTRTYVLASSYVGPTCATDYGLTNYHVSADVPGIPHTLDGIILEVDCSDDGPSGDLIENNSYSASAAMEVKNSISLPAPPHNSNGAFLSYQSGSTSGRHINAHNNTIVATGVAVSGTACGVGVETGAGVAGQYQYIRDNIFWQVNTTYGVGCGAEGNSTSVANLYETADHNDFFNITGSHYRNSGSVFTNAPGTGDQTVDPQFVDSTRNFLKWCQTLDNTITTWDGCMAKFAAHTSGFTPSALIDYVRAGFAPQNATIATMSTTGSYVGAVSPSVPSSATMTLSGVTLKGASVK